VIDPAALLIVLSVLIGWLGRGSERPSCTSSKKTDSRVDSLGIVACI
jgi:hypothetical protein